MIQLPKPSLSPAFSDQSQHQLLEDGFPQSTEMGVKVTSLLGINTYGRKTEKSKSSESLIKTQLIVVGEESSGSILIIRVSSTTYNGWTSVPPAGKGMTWMRGFSTSEADAEGAYSWRLYPAAGKQGFPDAGSG